MDTLSTILQHCFEGIHDSQGYIGIENNTHPHTPVVNMIVPIGSQSFEIPIFILNKINSLIVNDSSYDTAVVQLRTLGYHSTYSTVDSQFRHCFNSNYYNNALVKIKSKTDGTFYYVTRGAVFDSALSPLVIFSWKMRRERQDDTNVFEFLQPIMHISSNLFIDKEDDVQRYLCNKFFMEILRIDCISRYQYLGPGIYDFIDYSIKVCVEHPDTFPFKMQLLDTPSVNTTNADLCNLVLDNLNDLPL